MEIIKVEPHSYLGIRTIAFCVLVAVLLFSATLVFVFEYAFDVIDCIIPKNLNSIIIPIFIFLSISSIIGAYLAITTKSLYAFNPESKSDFRGYKFLGKEYGEWHPLDLNSIPNFSYIAFQSYNQTQTFNFMGVTKNEVDEDMFELRLICGQNFITLISTSEFSQLPNVVKLGRTMAQVYNVKYCDYVRDSYRKRMII
ncbi:MAG: hypothetical protein MJZ19_09475 [Paludibacteraceae bacterium]|nr:hypothetical protein [Paludibacteraceae bacterium]